MNMYQNVKNSNILAFKAIISVNWCLSCWTENDLNLVKLQWLVRILLRLHWEQKTMILGNQTDKQRNIKKTTAQ